jgi:hypothetical protein
MNPRLADFGSRQQQRHVEDSFMRTEDQALASLHFDVILSTAPEGGRGGDVREKVGSDEEGREEKPDDDGEKGTSLRKVLGTDGRRKEAMKSTADLISLGGVSPWEHPTHPTPKKNQGPAPGALQRRESQDSMDVYVKEMAGLSLDTDFVRDMKSPLPHQSMSGLLPHHSTAKLAPSKIRLRTPELPNFITRRRLDPNRRCEKSGILMERGVSTIFSSTFIHDFRRYIFGGYILNSEESAAVSSQCFCNRCKLTLESCAKAADAWSRSYAKCQYCSWLLPATIPRHRGWESWECLIPIFPIAITTGSRYQQGRYNKYFNLPGLREKIFSHDCYG